MPMVTAPALVTSVLKVTTNNLKTDFTLDDQCYLDYCNTNLGSNLQATYCGGGICSTTAQATACKSHWQTTGINISTSIYLDYCNAGINNPPGNTNTGLTLQATHCGGAKCTTAAQATACKNSWNNTSVNTSFSSSGFKPPNCINNYKYCGDYQFRIKHKAPVKAAATSCESANTAGTTNFWCTNSASCIDGYANTSY